VKNSNYSKLSLVVFYALVDIYIHIGLVADMSFCTLIQFYQEQIPQLINPKVCFIKGGK